MAGARGGSRSGAAESDAVHDHDHGHAHGHDHGHHHHHGHDHSHGLVDPSIVRSRDGVRTVAISLLVLALTAIVQTAIFALSGSVALLADLVHNFGDALTALPLGVAFYLRSFRLERLSGLFIVAIIFLSACVAFWQAVQRLLDPTGLDHLWALAAAGLIGLAGNEIAARIRLRGGRRLNSAALIADGKHARVDGIVSLGVVASAALVGIGLDVADPLIGFAISAVILKITWDSWRTIRSAEPAG